MDPVTLAAISAAAGATKSTVDALSSILSKAKGRDAEKAAREALLLVADLNTRLLALQEVTLRLHQEKAQALEENAKLRAEIRQKEEGMTERQKYQRKMVKRSIVLVREDEPDYFYCPTCFETKKQTIPLQPHPMGRSSSFGSHFCSQCRTSFRL